MAMTVRPDEAMQQALRELADAHETSMQDVLRTAVLQMWEREGHASRVAAGADRLQQRWGDVLDRLGTV